jgi:hypothetical protein
MTRNAKGKVLEPREHGTIKGGTFDVKLPEYDSQGKLKKSQRSEALTVDINNFHVIIRIGDTDLFFNRRNGNFEGYGTERGITQVDPDGTEGPPV